jgi:hypothetical protein
MMGNNDAEFYLGQKVRENFLVPKRFLGHKRRGRAKNPA